jgi:azurin
MQNRFLAAAASILLCAGFASPVWAANCTLAIEANDAMAYSAGELRVDSACSEITLTLRHTGTLDAQVMGHNWVLAARADFDALAAATATAEAADSYLPKNDARVLAFTRVIGGGESVTLTFPGKRLKKGGDYVFFCSFPGHWSLMKGRLVVN